MEVTKQALAPRGKRAISPTSNQLGVFLAGAYIFLQNAYVVADVTYLVPMSFTRLIAGAAIGMIFFSEWPTMWTWLGSFCILIATVSLCKHEVQDMKTKSPAPLPAAA